MKSIIAVAAVAAMLAGVTIAQADDNPAKTPNQEKTQSGKVPPGTPNKDEATTGSGAMQPQGSSTGTMNHSNTPGVSDSKPYTPDTKAK